jgi:hypothetical protein
MVRGMRHATTLRSVRHDTARGPLSTAVGPTRLEDFHDAAAIVREPVQGRTIDDWWRDRLPELVRVHRGVLKKARTWSTHSSGCSSAAKWPPRCSSRQRWTRCRGPAAAEPGLPWASSNGIAAGCAGPVVTGGPRCGHRSRPLAAPERTAAAHS